MDIFNYSKLRTTSLVLIGFLGQIALAAQTTAADITNADPSSLGASRAGGVQMLKEKFIEGDWIWMSPVLIALIFGLAFCIERIITLNIAATNTDEMLNALESKLATGDIEGAMNVAKSTPGPAAALVVEGLNNRHKGAEGVEKAIISVGSVQMGLLERGLIWISLFISLAPMLGFLGTVVGMIQAFDKIETVGDISPTIVAGGIKVALLTTVFGLIVAIILQIFYNYIVSKIDNVVNRMEDASIRFVDLLEKYNIVTK